MFVKDLKEFNLSKTEEKVLDYWKTNQVFEKTLAARKKGRRFVFFEGPPTANGRPGIHHVLARAFKDVILRYKTMRGYYVPRRAGWDTHGLPVEIQVEKELGLKSKKDIEKYGIAEFNKKCRESVWKFKDEWERLTERMGFWLDMRDPYVTYEKDYMETLWWIIAQFWKKKLLYKGHKIVNWCTRCGTGLSSHEMAQGYKEVVDNSVYVKFKLKKGQKIGKDFSVNDKTFILSWTTTPWTLPGNLALAVGEKIDYVFSKQESGEIFILAKERFESLGLSGPHEKVFKGKELVGLAYEPLFEVKPLESKNSYKIYGADFVTTTDGTGVVHTAVMYGEDDYKLGVKLGLPQHHTVDEIGKFTRDVKVLAGLYVKAQETEKKIFEHLTKNNNLLKIETYKHEYPHCWRCSTPLLYYARSSWFVAMAKLKKELLKNNEAINWIPEHVKEGRFGEWLKDVKDWNFSRERYWGTPLPVWECKKCWHTDVVEGLEDLSKKLEVAENRYILMRHGHSQNFIDGVLDNGKGRYHLTSIGRKQVKKGVEGVKSLGVDVIFSSPILRAKETAEIVAEELGVKKVIFDSRLKEVSFGVFDGKKPDGFTEFFKSVEDRFKKAPKGGETLREVKDRVWDFVVEVEKKYNGKNILIVSHDDSLWMLYQAMMGWTDKESMKEKKKRGRRFFELGVCEEVEFPHLPKNEYLLMRHGEAESNILGVWDSGDGNYSLTSKGRKQAETTAEVLKKEEVDMIFASDVTRAKETAGIVAKALGKKIIFDKRLREMQVAEYSGRKGSDYFDAFPMYGAMFDGAPAKGESLTDLRTRLWDFIKDIEGEYRGKKILIVTHDYDAWMLGQVMEGWTKEEAVREMRNRNDAFLERGSFEKVFFRKIPRSETGEVDMHRPYVDDVVLKCAKCKGDMRRVKELCDVWFDSGSMPLAQTHYPFSKEKVEFPADYISEAVDQTRGWFYTLLAVATALGKSAPYKNVICLGHINDKFGAKMSKSKGNIVDPWQMAEKYGMDAVRWYMYSATPPGEPKNFDELELAKTYRRFHLILWNSLLFYKTYVDQKVVKGEKLNPKNVLDRWILARLEETKSKATKSFDKYQIREATQEIEKLTDDLSRWYIRRSRRRLQKAENKKDYEDCSQTLRYVLGEVLKMAAPFNPFFSEILWSTLGEKDSVHLAQWTEAKSKVKSQKSKFLEEMEAVRNLAALGLAMRAEYGIKVRQPLSSMEVGVKLSKQFAEILEDEVNVKNVVFNFRLKGNEIVLDSSITPELKEEGIIRDLVRAVQELRQKAGLMPNDRIVVMFEGGDGLKEIVSKGENLVKKEVGAKTIEYKKSEKFDAESEVKIDEQGVWVGLRRV